MVNILKSRFLVTIEAKVIKLECASPGETMTINKCSLTFQPRVLLLNCQEYV